MSKNNISDKGIEGLINNFKGSIEELDISLNDLTAIGMKICKLKIKSLDISGNLVGDDGIMPFSDNINLIELRAEECNIGDAGVKYFLKKITP